MTGSPAALVEESVSSSSRKDPQLSTHSSAQSPHIRHRNNSATSSQMAWDVPPMVASPNDGSSNHWKIRSYQLCTPQRIATVLLLSDVNEDDDDNNNNDNMESLLQVESSDDETLDEDLEMTNRLDEPGHNMPSSYPSTACSSLCPPLLWNSDRMIVVLITGEIRVYRLTITNEETTSSLEATISIPISTLTLPSDATIVTMIPLDTNSIVLLSVEGHVYQIKVDGLELEHSWNTGSCGGTSMTFDKMEGLLLIGYSTGPIECYQWNQERRHVKRKPICIWKGWVEDWYSVQSLEILSCPECIEPSSKGLSEDPTPTSGTKDDDDSLNNRDLVETNVPLLLLVTLQTSIGDDPPVVHALDLRAILSHVASTRSSTRQDASEPLLLASFRLLADPAMDIMEPSITSLPPPHKLPSGLIPSHGTNQILSLSGKCGVALSNGTVAIVSPGWGVRNDTDQLLLSYPSIGMGKILWNQTEYLVCCLRAGTCYLIPTSSQSSEISVMFYPHDIDADTTQVYVQAFTAGSLRQPSNGRVELPVFVYVFPGGVIEVYTCQILSSNEPVPSIQDQIVEELIQKGCLEMIFQVLEQDLGENNALWNNAKQEWQSFGKDKDKPKTFTLNDLMDCPALHRLMLHMASTDMVEVLDVDTTIVLTDRPCP